MWGQCTQNLKATVEALDKHAKFCQEANPIDLLKVIQYLQHLHSELEYYAEAVMKVEEHFYCLKQHEH